MITLYRSEREGKIAGICAGIAEGVGVDPTIVRLVTVFICAMTGFFPLLITYLVGWFLIPEKSYRSPHEDSNN